MRNDVLRTYVGAQGDDKAVTKFMKSYDPKDSVPPNEAADTLLTDIAGGFKGLS